MGLNWNCPDRTCSDKINVVIYLWDNGFISFLNCKGKLFYSFYNYGVESVQDEPISKNMQIIGLVSLIWICRFEL